MGRLENSSSDRRLVEHCAMRLAILLFLGYELDEELPWHSTVSRTRQLYPAALFEHFFDRIFHLRVAQGLVVGATQTPLSLERRGPATPFVVSRWTRRRALSATSRLVSDRGNERQPGGEVAVC